MERHVYLTVDIMVGKPLHNGTFRKFWNLIFYHIFIPFKIRFSNRIMIVSMSQDSSLERSSVENVWDITGKRFNNGPHLLQTSSFLALS